MDPKESLADIDTGSSPEDTPFLTPTHVDQRPQTQQKSLKISLTIHLTLILLYTALSIALILSFHTPASQEIHNALPEIHTKYKHYQYPLLRESPFAGPPSASRTAAWHELFGNMSLRVTTSELAHSSLSSVSLPGGGHLAWLGVFHELHCIKKLHQANYRDYYHPGVTGQELRDLQTHADHCTELLRATAMCRPDVDSLTTFVWHKGWKRPLLSPERPVRRCVDWDVLMDSIQERIVGEQELNDLENPTW
ncbi:hypothetical protein LARI1_G008887 [Lachnellula arida]|uniref:Oxidase ustYa n=1 Tax=Lachnellula arida TaxID=1316785 RepID=A0A8T9B3F7_9HELO|nr:hypothetical protein LARI1_G008887 [Lachnellula arida]